ncbi:MAG: endo-1,4-beta-xylanase [candidate division KSB1 bacterium]|nr:endo-1,4-beta-xylanase [candidate division KSB1 bacterium]
MKAKSICSLLVVIPLFVPVCWAQEDIAAKLTPAAINARIAEIRMGDLVVKTKPGAEVKVQQVRHEFLFGTAITNHLAENDENPMSPEDRKMFLKVLAENFNYAVHENALKWYDCEKQPNVVDYSVADRIWAICDSLHIPMRGHCIFWEKDKYIMPWLNELNNDELRAAVIRRAMDVTKHFKGRIEEFDLNNEMIHGDFFRRRLGYGIINEMAYAAKAGNPDITLFVNDYGILVEGGYNANTYITQIENLLANGVPIGGIGCQGHFVTLDKANSSGRAITRPEHVQRTLDRLAKFNLPIKITECLFIADDEEGKAEALRMFFPICFAHPSVEAILMWGFWEVGHWVPETAMWKKDWTPTPQALAYRDLVFNQWWTQTSGKADKNGIFKTRAFYGDYLITSKGKTQKVTLSKKDKSIQVIFR